MNARNRCVPSIIISQLSCKHPSALSQRTQPPPSTATHLIKGAAGKRYRSWRSRDACQHVVLDSVECRRSRALASLVSVWHNVMAVVCRILVSGKLEPRMPSSLFTAKRNSGSHAALPHGQRTGDVST